MRLEMGENHCMNEHDNILYLLFYKGTTDTNYQEECHVLALNNCVLMANLFVTFSRKGNIEASMANSYDKDIGLEEVDDQLYFESERDYENIQSPNKNHNDLSRFHKNIMTFVRPMTI
jgi:hypothetical protein